MSVDELVARLREKGESFLSAGGRPALAKARARFAEPTVADTLEGTAADALESLTAELGRLREALEPFAKAADEIDDKMEDKTGIWQPKSNFRECAGICVGDLRRARTALKEKTSG